MEKCEQCEALQDALDARPSCGECGCTTPGKHRFRCSAYADAVTNERDEARAQCEWLLRALTSIATATPWGDSDLPEDDAIRKAFPTHTGDHATYVEAMRLVGARRSKGELVALVNWLLVERDAAVVRGEKAEADRDEFEAELHGRESPTRRDLRLAKAENARLGAVLNKLAAEPCQMGFSDPFSTSCAERKTDHPCPFCAARAALGANK